MKRTIQRSMLLRLVLSAAVAACSAGTPTQAVGPDTSLASVASVALNAASTTLTAGQVTTITATVRNAAGAAMPSVPIQWSGSSEVAVASSGATATVTALRPGTATITAAAADKSASAQIGILLQPGASDVILMDLRQPLQQATTATEALSLFPGNDHTALRGARNTRGWSFSTNFDGQGTHALRVDWAQQTGDQEVRLISYLPSPKPREVYVQYKARLGKHPSDPDGNGNDNAFPLFPASTGPKRFLIGRTDVGGSANGRLDYVWTRSNPSAVRAQIDWFNWGINARAADWNPQGYIGRTYTTTIYVKVSSSNGTTNGAADGIYRVWIDGALVLNGTNLSIGSWALDLLNFPTINGEVPAPCSEYYWDFLIWRPGA